MGGRTLDTTDFRAQVTSEWSRYPRYRRRCTSHATCLRERKVGGSDVALVSTALAIPGTVVQQWKQQWGVRLTKAIAKNMRDNRRCRLRSPRRIFRFRVVLRSV